MKSKSTTEARSHWGATPGRVQQWPPQRHNDTKVPYRILEGFFGAHVQYLLSQGTEITDHWSVQRISPFFVPVLSCSSVTGRSSCPLCLCGELLQFQWTCGTPSPSDGTSGASNLWTLDDSC